MKKLEMLVGVGEERVNDAEALLAMHVVTSHFS